MVKETLHQEILSKKCLSILSAILGENLYVIYCPSLEFEDGVFTARSFSIRVKDNWINIMNSWKETPSEISYYELSIESSDSPQDIEYIPNERTLKHPVSSILFNRGKDGMMIKKIEVYKKANALENEKVIYDFALKICAENNFTLCINVKEDISDQLECRFTESAINETLQDTELRIVLE